MFAPRVTLKQVAAEAGVHVSTAWRALKNDTYVEAAKRARIREVAKRLGYTPDPMLTALSHYRRRQHPPSYQSTFAWINAWPQSRVAHEPEHLKAYYGGAEAFANSMGFRLEEFWLSEPGMTSRRAREVLQARNIRGLVFAPFPSPGAHLSLDLESFSCVALGYSISTPRLHVIANHHHRSTLLCLRQLVELGHRRIGMVSASQTLRRTEHSFESPFCLFQSLQEESQRVPLFVIPGADEPANVNTARASFLAWFERHRPTALISTVSEVRDWLAALGLNFPADLSLVTLSRIHDPEWSGIDQQERLIGSRAVELLISLFQSGERGLPATPLRLLVEGRWIDHGTTRRLGPPATDLLDRLG